MHLLKNPVGIDVTVGSPGGTVERPRFGFGARVPGIAIIVLAQGILGVMQRAVKESVRHYRKYVRRRQGYTFLDFGERHQRPQTQGILIRRPFVVLERVLP